MTTRNPAPPEVTLSGRSAAWLALEQWIVAREHASLVLEHDGDAVADRIGKPVDAADQQRLLALMTQRSLADRAGQDIEQPCIHALLR